MTALDAVGRRAAIEHVRAIHVDPYLSISSKQTYPAVRASHSERSIYVQHVLIQSFPASWKGRSHVFERVILVVKGDMWGIQSFECYILYVCMGTRYQKHSTRLYVVYVYVGSRYNGREGWLAYDEDARSSKKHGYNLAR